MNWLDHHPDDLIERFEPADALALLRQQTALTLEQMGKLDAYLHHWSLVLMQRSNDPEGVQEMLSLSEIAQDLTPQDMQGTGMKQRWSGFEDLLEGKRRHLQAARTPAPIQLKQQDTIVQIIQQAENGRVKQLDLAVSLKLSKGRVSQILGVLESRSLITRQRRGKESWVSLASTGETPVSPAQKTAHTPTLEHLGAKVFSRAA
ncbi:helix-turn-helix transcriptional regulator [Ideonella sp.]|jgi:hypothetical protein|uniref:helix-turn-helix transcriptional regulator n=1 Tax=Ideonella sp. TaxID=1929293 RepID=UPI0037BE7EB4